MKWIIGAVVIVVLLAGGLAWWFWPEGSEETAELPPEPTPAQTEPSQREREMQESLNSLTADVARIRQEIKEESSKTPAERMTEQLEDLTGSVEQATTLINGMDQLGNSFYLLTGRDEIDALQNEQIKMLKQENNRLHSRIGVDLNELKTGQSDLSAAIAGLPEQVREVVREELEAWKAVVAGDIVRQVGRKLEGIQDNLNELPQAIAVSLEEVINARLAKLPPVLTERQIKAAATAAIGEAIPRLEACCREAVSQEVIIHVRSPEVEVETAPKEESLTEEPSSCDVIVWPEHMLHGPNTWELNCQVR